MTSQPEIDEDDIFEKHRAKLKEIKTALREAGFSRVGGRFPFSMHHNFYRTKIRICGKKSRHKDIRRLLAMWMETRRNPDDLLWQMVSGAIKDLIKKDPGLVVKLPIEIRRGMATVEDGYSFLRFTKDLNFQAVAQTGNSSN